MIEEINPEITLILDYPLSYNKRIEEFYNKMGIDFRYNLDFINTMILWGYQKLFFPAYFDQQIERALSDGS